MKKIYWLIGLLVYSFGLHAQTVQERVAKAVEKLQLDSQMKHAILGLSIVKSETGEKIFEVNAQTGLAPASCQKTITSAAAMELWVLPIVTKPFWDMMEPSAREFERKFSSDRQRRSFFGKLAL
jgi:hypothetical protein